MTTLNDSTPAVVVRPKLTFCTDVRPSDVAAVGEIVASSGFFSNSEIAVAMELAEDRLARGAKSDYRFVFADIAGRPVAYSCYGPIACTQGSFDLYWIAVHDDYRGKGIGRTVLMEAERLMKREGARRIYIETSSREQYRPTRAFYERCGYAAEATLEHFYALNDGKVICVKALS